jgi:hypothetical protein
MDPVALVELGLGLGRWNTFLFLIGFDFGF